jgi:hypothetical protein
MPAQVRTEAEAKLGKHRVFYAPLSDDNVHDSRAAMEEGRATDFDGAFLDIWLLARCAAAPSAHRQRRGSSCPRAPMRPGTGVATCPAL